MTEQELHEKLTDILQMKLQELPLKPLGIIYKEAAEYLAVALIAAGIGDVSELQKECDSKEEAYNRCYFYYKYWKNKAKDFKHSARKAIADILCEDSCYFCNKRNNGCDVQCHEFATKECIDRILMLAKKELQEERKDD